MFEPVTAVDMEGRPGWEVVAPSLVITPLLFCPVLYARLLSAPSPLNPSLPPTASLPVLLSQVSLAIVLAPVFWNWVC